MNKTEQIVLRMMGAINVKTLAKLAKYLDISAQTITTWKARKTIPYKECMIISEREILISMDYLITGIKSYDEKLLQDTIEAVINNLEDSDRMRLINAKGLGQIITTLYDIFLDIGNLNNKILKGFIDNLMKNKK